MDLVIVDYDCRKMPADQIRIWELLGLPEQSEMFFMEEAGWEEKHWIIPENFSDKINRCVFLTCFTGGVKKYHQDLFTNNPQILSWIISVLDVEHEGYKKQLLAQIDQAFRLSDAYYDVVFDSSDMLRETRKHCILPARTQKRCLVVSQKKELAERVRSVMEGYLESWEVVSTTVTSAEEYRFADAVIVAGEQVEDLAVPAPAAGLNRRYVWLNRRFLASEEYEELTDAAGEIMNGCGWNISDYRSCLYSSDFVYEKLYQDIMGGEIGYSALREHEDFVMWDAYGLPAVREDYTPEHIAVFLEQNCCFARLKERISMKSRRRI